MEFWMTFHSVGNNKPNWLRYFSEGWRKTTNQLQLLTPILDVFHTSCAGHHSHIRWRSCHRNQNTFCSSDVGFSSLPQDVYAGDEGEAKSSNRIAWQKPRGVQSSTGFSRARNRSAAEDFGCERGLSITLVRWILHGEFAYRMHWLHKGTASNSSSRGPSSLFRSPWLCDELYWSSAALWPNGLEGKGLQMSHVGSFCRISIHSWYSHIFITVELELDMVAGGRFPGRWRWCTPEDCYDYPELVQRVLERTFVNVKRWHPVSPPPQPQPSYWRSQWTLFLQERHVKDSKASGFWTVSDCFAAGTLCVRLKGPGWLQSAARAVGTFAAKKSWKSWDL